MIRCNISFFLFIYERLQYVYLVFTTYILKHIENYYKNRLNFHKSCINDVGNEYHKQVPLKMIMIPFEFQFLKENNKALTCISLITIVAYVRTIVFSLTIRTGPPSKLFNIFSPYVCGIVWSIHNTVNFGLLYFL